jgi:hypothetical protein
MEMNHVTGDLLLQDANQDDQPASIEQLEALPGASAEFILTQLKLSASLPEAQRSLNQMLAEELAATRRRLDDLRERFNHDD